MSQDGTAIVYVHVSNESDLGNFSDSACNGQAVVGSGRCLWGDVGLGLGDWKHHCLYTKNIFNSSTYHG